MKVHEFDIIVNKLGMETRDSKDHHAWFVYNGVRVVKTKRSHGNSKFIPQDKIRQQLKVNESQLAGLIACHIKKEHYIQILIDKGIIAAPSSTEQAIS